MLFYYEIFRPTHCTECKHQIFTYFLFRLIVNITSHSLLFPSDPLIRCSIPRYLKSFSPSSSFSWLNGVISTFPPQIVKIATHLTPLTQSKTCRTSTGFPLNKNQIINQLFTIEIQFSNLVFQTPISTSYLNSGFHLQSRWAQHIVTYLAVGCTSLRKDTGSHQSTNIWLSEDKTSFHLSCLQWCALSYCWTDGNLPLLNKHISVILIRKGLIRKGLIRKDHNQFLECTIGLLYSLLSPVHNVKQPQLPSLEFAISDLLRVRSEAHAVSMSYLKGTGA